jgi:hypothetical protein
MAMKRVIEGVHVVPMGMANAFLTEGDDGLTLIDAGYRGKEAAVFGAIRGVGRSPDQLAISGARNRLLDMGDACFGSNSAVAGRCAGHNLSRIRLIKRAPSLNDRALDAFIRLTQCASKRTLYCASSRSSLCVATHIRRSGTSMWSATTPGSLAEAPAALRSAACRCGPSRGVTTAGLRVVSIQTSR